MMLYNIDRQRAVVDNLEIAEDPLSRTRGLLGHRPLKFGEGLMIDPVRWIHTFGMSFPIDVVYIGKDWRVVALTENLSPGRIDRPVLRARCAIEMAAGAIRRAGLQVGDRLELSP
jgi:uncharacterized membrane protein (UPF0127 family)